MGPLTQAIMQSALQLLDKKWGKKNSHQKLVMMMGGGGAMILAHGFPRGTTDIDAIAKDVAPDQLGQLIHEVATELQLEPDWLNPYFSTFSHTLPTDYAERLVTVYDGPHLRVDALGKEDLLIMKCFAHRTKDIPHARALIRAKADLKIVENRLEELLKKKIPGAQAAIDFLQETLDAEDASDE